MPGRPWLPLPMPRCCTAVAPRLFARALTLAVAAATARQSPAPTKPHIFFLYVDDWGWGNVGYHRPAPDPEVLTPSIDSIVADGVQLNRMYAYPYCAPSRAAAISGRLPHHVNTANIRGATYDPNATAVGGQGIPRNMTTLPQMLAAAKYWSVFAGKWDVGFATRGHIPAGRGFARSLAYFFQINDYWTQGMVGSEGHSWYVTHTYGAVLFARALLGAAWLTD